MKNKAFFLATLFFTIHAFAELPVCMDKKERMDFNESQLLTWREFMDNKFIARGFIKGSVVGLIEDRQKHVHLEVDLDENINTNDDRIEVIYNSKYGELPPTQVGDEVVACGDFVVDKYSNFQAVLHWLHTSPKPKTHEHGYLAINGVVYGVVDIKDNRK